MPYCYRVEQPSNDLTYIAVYTCEGFGLELISDYATLIAFHLIWY